MTNPLPRWFHDDSTGPATHALVIGTSTYPHRPLGLPDLPGAALSAQVFARWLREGYPGDGRRLGSIRLLLAPSVAEANQVSSGLDVLMPDQAIVQQALEEWADDCRSSAENVAVLYVCGHGVQETDDGALVFVHDARDADPLKAAIDIAGIRHGMVGDDSPDRQWYFADTCRVPSAVLNKKFRGPLAGRITLPELQGKQPAHRPVFFAAEPGTFAWQSGAGSVFMQALRRSLELDAIHLPPGASTWGITAQSLLLALRRLVPQLAKAGGRSQAVTIGGSMTDAYLLECGPPMVPVTLVITPAEAERAGGLSAEIFDGLTDTRVLERRPTPVVEVPVRSGIWTLSLTFDPPSELYVNKPAIGLSVQPPRVCLKVPVQ
jgi:hypothetical protein